MVYYITTHGVSFKDHFRGLPFKEGRHQGASTQTSDRHRGPSSGTAAGEGDLSEEAALELAQLLFNRLKMPGVQIITERDIRDFLPAQAAS